jgi:hypothetical protein
MGQFHVKVRGKTPQQTLSNTSAQSALLVAPISALDPIIIERISYETKQVPVEVIREVPVEVIREVRIEVPVETIREVIKEVPIEIVREVEKLVIKEVIKNIEIPSIRTRIEYRTNKTALLLATIIALTCGILIGRI